MTGRIQTGDICRYTGGEIENLHVLCTALQRFTLACGCEAWNVEVLTSAVVQLTDLEHRTFDIGLCARVAPGTICSVAARYLVPLPKDDAAEPVDAVCLPEEVRT